METIRVIIIDEQPLFREGIRATLERMGDCVVVGESTDAADVFEIARTGSPDRRARARSPRRFRSSLP